MLHTSSATVVVALALLAMACAPQQKKGAVRDPSDSDVERIRYEMAERLVHKRDYQNAGPYIKSLLRKYPQNGRLRLLLGKVLRAKGVYRGAERELKAALKLRPRDADVHAALGVLYGFTKRRVEAERAHRSAVSLAPTTARYHNDLGAFLLAQRRLKEARDVLEEAIRIDPTMRRAFNNLGFVLGLMGKGEASMKAFSQAGSRAAALTNMGLVAQLRGQPNSARRYYERALRVERGFAPALKNLEALEPGRFGDDESTTPTKEGAQNEENEPKKK